MAVSSSPGQPLSAAISYVGAGIFLVGSVTQFLSEVDQLIPLPPLMLIVLGLFAAAAKPATVLHQRVEQRFQSKRRREQKLKQMVARWPLPTVAAMDPYSLGVFNSRIANKYAHDEERPPYIPRDIDGQLREKLATDPFVLILGPSKSGKSRTAYEACAAMYPDKQIIIPRSPRDVSELFKLDPPLPLETKPALLWLDHLLFEGTSSLDSQLLREWTSGSSRKLVIVATMSLDEFEKLRKAGDEMGKQAQQVINLAKDPVRLSAGISEDEARTAAELYGEVNIAGGSRIGEYFFAAHELVQKFLNGFDICPEGYALVSAAIDWRRARGRQPMTEAELRALYPQYFKRLRPHADDGDDQVEEGYEKGLEWARETVESSAALLIVKERDGQRNVLVFDYLVEHVDAHPHEVDASLHGMFEETLGYVIRNANAADALEVGAAFIQENQQAAIEAFRKAAASYHPVAAPIAALNLGNLLRDQGDIAGAKVAYQQAIDSGHADMAPKAAVNLGVLIKKQGELEKARVLFQEAIDSEHPDAKFTGVVNLGNLLRDQGDIAGARVAYQQAINSGHVDMAPMAAVNQANLFEVQGDFTEARTFYRQAIDSGHADMGPRAAVNLGSLLKEQGDIGGAKVAYQQAIDSGHADMGPRAAVNLGSLLKEQGDIGGAKVAYQQAIDSGHADMGPRAAFNLGSLLEEQGDISGATVAYQQAIDSGHADMGPRAAVNLGSLLKEQGDIGGAKVAYQQAIDSGHADVAPIAVNNLGSLLRDLAVDLERTSISPTDVNHTSEPGPESATPPQSSR